MRARLARLMMAGGTCAPVAIRNRPGTGPCNISFGIDRRRMLPFCGSVGTSDARLLADREPDDALGLTAMAAEVLADARTGVKGRHALVGMLRQSVFGRLTGHEKV